MLRLSFLYLASFLVLATGSTVAAQHPISQAQITADIEDKLYHAGVFEHGNVQVSFENGVATLSGTVDSVGVKTDADRAVRRIDDVSEIVDNINVHAEDVTPRDIAEQARHEILTYYAYTIFDWVTLDVQGDRLVVDGQVSQPYKKDDIGRFLSHVKGVAEVDNHLEVLPTSNYDDQLRLAIARAIYNDPFFIQYAGRANPSIHIIVDNGNVTLEGVVASPLDRSKAEADARLAATFFGFTDHLRVEGA